ncbi:MAG: endonuclease III [Candidatus Theseobacter exili]|nr:endonuclease III [Candidatus Theseobacter exili]
MEQEKINNLILHLKKAYPNPEIELDYTSPLELLVATILSAQCTDKRVNIVTKTLFNKHRTLKDYFTVNQSVLENEIKSTGFFRQKARSIVNCCLYIQNNHGGKVPKTMTELTSLPGVGRKTASVVLANGYGIPAIAVDTHVIRISNRLGLVNTKNPEKIEFALMKQLPEKHWGFFSNAVILHGRRICKARKPLCNNCIIKDLCNYFKNGGLVQ